VEIYEKRCALPIREADDKEPVEPGRCISPTGLPHAGGKNRQIALSTDEPVHFSRPSVDVLFESAATCTAIACSGNPNRRNEDGAAGLHAIHRAGGVTVVQQPDSAKAPLMVVSRCSATRRTLYCRCPKLRSCCADWPEHPPGPKTSNGELSEVPARR